ncbi:hypothetical protein FA15DRAFT_710958 [Coprinopsis marcescibilis]|uniref:Uncharacterized protein n=1 Tax=Coprinopsis marcescibilis TaxID=230819 RepID=A0A5C3KBJ6_COPMA|nr:hypothetical protein FA15DRAFT_710958 [Coprinopsis marcescibilis]
MINQLEEMLRKLEASQISGKRADLAKTASLLPSTDGYPDQTAIRGALQLEVRDALLPSADATLTRLQSLVLHRDKCGMRSSRLRAMLMFTLLGTLQADVRDMLSPPTYATLTD